MSTSNSRALRIRLLTAVLTVAVVALTAGAGEEKPAKTEAKVPPAAETKADPKADKPAEETISENEEVILIGDIPTAGWPILPATETEYKFKLKDTGTIVSLRWLDLKETERDRLRRVYKMEVRNGQKVFGDAISMTRFKMENGKTIEGLRVPERDRLGQKAIKTRSVPMMWIPESGIRNEEPFEGKESDAFSPMEVYQKWLTAKPISHNDAAAHFAMAQKVANIELFGKAIDHLKMAAAIDPLMEERNKDFYAQLVAEDAKQRTLELYNNMLMAMRRMDFGSALDMLEQLDRNFPNSDYKTRWEGLRPQVEAGLKTEITKRIVQMAYSTAMDLVQQRLFKKVRVDPKGNVVPSIPGKQVTTKAGHIFRGTLEGQADETSASGTGDATAAAGAGTTPTTATPAGTTGTGSAGQDMILRINEKRVTIRGKDIVSVQDIDLSVSEKEIVPAFDDLKDWITDTSRPDGLKAQMVAKIAKVLRSPEAKVKEVFDGRLAQEQVYEGGVLTSTPLYATFHDAAYGAGTWLRDGMRPGPRTQGNVNNNNQNNNRNWNNRGNNNNNNNQIKPPDPDEMPDTTDDPNVWWKFQNTETQLGVLRALAADKVFKVRLEDVKKIACPSCRNIGYLPGKDPANNTPIMERCPLCRGIGVLIKLSYR
ncbi:MAG TPA: hypothetical protein VGP72_30800 [Planctomycetota bacterium]